MVPVDSVRVSRAPTYSGYHSRESRFRLQGLHLLRLTFQCHSTISFQSLVVVLLPQLVAGLGCSDFARHYFRNHCCFLFLRLLRCFSSAGSLRMAMDLPCGTGGLLRWVSPFRYLRINSYLPIPAAFRSLSRPSSADMAQASAVRPFLLNLPSLSF